MEEFRLIGRTRFVLDLIKFDYEENRTSRREGTDLVELWSGKILNNWRYLIYDRYK